MVKYYCDRCKRREETDRVNVLQIKKVNSDTAKRYHLCKNCFDKFAEFLMNVDEDGDEEETDDSEKEDTEEQSKKKLQRGSPSPTLLIDWQPDAKVKGILEMKASNCIREEDYDELNLKTRMNKDLKIAIINLRINGYGYDFIASVAQMSASGVNQVYRMFTNKVVEKVNVPPDKKVDIMNLLRAGWAIRDISYDTNTSVMQVLKVKIMSDSQG